MSCDWIDFRGRSAASCRRCHIAQYIRPDNNCVRCHSFLLPIIPPIEAQRTQRPAVFPYLPGRGPVEQIPYIINLFRRSQDMSQRQLAKKLQVPRSYVSKLENLKTTPSLVTMLKLATAFGISLHFFVLTLESLDTANGGGDPVRWTHAPAHFHLMQAQAASSSLRESA